MKSFSGIPASSGIAIGKAFLHTEHVPEIPRQKIQKSGLDSELKRFRAALNAASEEMKSLQERAEREMGREQASIFAAHLLMMEDPDFQDQITADIKKNLRNAEWALWETAQDFTQKLTAAGDPVLQERAADITDISKRILYQLLSINRISLADFDGDVILAAHDLLPSEALTMNKARVKGIILDMGSRTSHTAILARTFNIPAVLGLSSVSREIQNGDTLIVDGNNGKVFINPEKKILDKYRKIESLNRQKQDEDLALRDLPAETTDGFRVLLKANIGLPEEAEQALEFGAEGIGLYRSEFLFLAPGKDDGEEYQFEAYSRVFQAMGDRPVTIRTVDLGGDKILADFQKTDEKNPLLGWRAIRLSLALPDFFKTQLRAILRAAAKGNGRIMFPLVSGIEELEQSLALLKEAEKECRKKGQAAAKHIEAGVMIEVPSAAIIAGILAEKSAFFSIGTNDLVQYSLAVDRGNEQVNYLAQPCHPAVIRLIKTTIDAAHAKGIKAAMCGEMAGDPSLTALLLGLGLDEFSMSAPSIPRVKRIIRGAAMKDCRDLAGQVLAGTSSAKNLALVNSWMKERFPQ